MASSSEIRTVTDTYFPRIHRAALVLCGNPWDADDLAQETFLVMSRQLDGFRKQSTLYTWLYGILLNLERRERRRRGMQRNKLHVLWDQDSAERTAPPAEAAVEVAEWKKSLWNYVSRLPDGQRQTLVLRFSEHLSYEEIATVLECPLGTVKSRIFNGLEALRQLMEADGQEHRAVPPFPQEDLSHVI